jgi:hypothetical protein
LAYDVYQLIKIKIFTYWLSNGEKNKHEVETLKWKGP